MREAGGGRRSMDDGARFSTTKLGEKFDTLAPDGSEIRVLLRTTAGSTAHATLPPGQVSRAVTHRRVEEFWYVLSGRGKVWRKQGEREQVDTVGPGTALTIPLGTHFQFRTVGLEPFCFVICTVPPWPDDETVEAVPVDGKWAAKVPD
jgi:mannose-6-phosphate isomerase-like protein (cupin superfamily)